MLLIASNQQLFMTLPVCGGRIAYCLHLQLYNAKLALKLMITEMWEQKSRAFTTLPSQIHPIILNFRICLIRKYSHATRIQKMPCSYIYPPICSCGHVPLMRAREKCSSALRPCSHWPVGYTSAWLRVPF